MTDFNSNAGDELDRALDGPRTNWIDVVALVIVLGLVIWVLTL